MTDASTPALAAPIGVKVLSQMLMEAQAREASALMRAHALAEQVSALQAELGRAKTPVRKPKPHRKSETTESKPAADVPSA